MRRGINDDFYFARSDEGACSDSLNVLKITAEGSKLICTTKQLAGPFNGAILALELDPLNNNDVESSH